MLMHREDSLRALHAQRDTAELAEDLGEAFERLEAVEADALAKDEAIVELYEMIAGGADDGEE